MKETPWITPLTENFPLPTHIEKKAPSTEDTPVVKETPALLLPRPVKPPVGIKASTLFFPTKVQLERLPPFRKAKIGSYDCPECGGSLDFCYEVIGTAMYKRYRCPDCTDYEVFTELFKS